MRHGIGGRLFVLLTFACLSSIAVVAAPESEKPPLARVSNTPSSLPLLTINDLRLFREIAASDRKTLAHPVELEFSINYYDPILHFIWAEGDRITALIPVVGTPPHLRSGQRLRVSGKMVPAVGLDVEHVKIEVIGIDAVPMPIRCPLENLQGRDGRIVRLEGLVDRQVETDANHLILEVISEGRRVVFHVWHEVGETFPDYKDTRVYASGVSVARFDPEHRPISVDLWVSTLAHLTPLSSLAADPRFTEPITPLSELSHRDLRNVAHVAGTVETYEPGQRIVVRDVSGQIELATEQRQPLQVGEAVEVVGYTSREEAGWTLRDPLFRARSPHPSAPPEQPARLLQTRDVLELGLQEAEKKHPVKLSGIVTFAHPDWGTFYLNDGGAGLLVSLGSNQMLQPSPGSSVTITGTTLGGLVSPSVSADRISVHGTVPLPAAVSLTVPQAAMGLDDGQWVEMRGLLQQIRVLDGWLSLRLNALEEEIYVSIPTQDTPQIPLGADLRVRGVCASWISTATHKFGGFFLFTPSLSEVQVLDATESATLGLVDQVRRLRENAGHGQPVKLNGVVTFSHPAQRLFYLNDGTASIQVQVTDENGILPPSGAAVTVIGKTAFGPLSPTVQASRVTVYGKRPLPAPRVITLEQALTGAEDGQWVEMYGNLRQIEPTSGWARLTLTVSAGELIVNVPVAERPKLTLGSFLRVHGVCANWASAKNQLGGVFIYPPSIADVEIMESAPADPFSLPEVSISKLSQFLSTPGQQVLIRGVVLQHVLGRYLFVENAGGVVCVLSRDQKPLVPGDRVDVVGLPGRERNELVLRGAIYRRTASGAPPKPLDPPGGLKLDTALNGRLVTFSGTLLDLSLHAENTHLFVQTGRAVHEVVFEGSIPKEISSTWKPGSLVSVLGLYRIDYNEYGQPTQFSVQLRTPQEVVVLKQPAWWTVQRALLGLGVIGGCLILGLGWAASLRRRVQQQTIMIRAQLAKEANIEARQRDIVENASDFIFTTDLTGKFTSFNPAGERLTGYPRDEALRLNIRDLISPEDAASGAALLSLALAPEESGIARFETRFKTRDGGRVWMETSARLVREAGEPVGLLGVARDIGERKQIEDQLKRAHAAAEATTRAKSVFLANMSHEIRTPMTGVIGMTNLLLETPLRSDQREFAEAIHGSAEALLTILNDILDFSKIEAGKLQFEVIDFDLTAPVDDSLGLLAARAVAKKIELAADLAVDLPRQVCGDPGRLRQVLLNLIGNAVKFTEQGEVVVSVSAETETHTDVRVRFEVSDTGIGMSEEAQQQLFNPFMQADSSTTRKFGGTGLGLAISKQIVELMGGQIGVRSELGRGSTFWFTVELKKQPHSVSLNALPELARLKGLRVLAVDDNATNRRILGHYLQGWNLRCDLVESGSDALRLAASAAASGDPYRLILLDYAMPEMDGVALTRVIRCNRAYDQIPVMLLTSLDRRFSREELAEVGLSSVLIKPIRQGDLQRTILRLLGDTLEKETTPPQALAASTAQAPANAPSLRVIVAEDNAVNQRIIQMQLKKLGINPDLVSNGVELLKAMEQQAYDLVLMDCQMPEMDGYEATRQLRASGRFPHLRVIAMTANAMQGDRERCLAAGMDDYLSKPTRADDLRAALARWSPRANTSTPAFQNS